MKYNQYILNTVHGSATATISVKNGSWKLFVGLSLKGDAGKIKQYLSQCGHASRLDAVKSWESMQWYFEQKLEDLAKEKGIAA
jgi:hypothetical protein